MLGRLAVWGSLGIWSAAKLRVGEMATPTQGAGGCRQELEGASQLPPFSQKAVCEEPHQQTQSPRRPGEPQLQEEPAEPSKDAAGAEPEPVCRKQGCTDTQDFIAKAPVPPDLSQALGRGARGSQGPQHHWK